MLNFNRKQTSGNPNKIVLITLNERSKIYARNNYSVTPSETCEVHFSKPFVQKKNQ
jgi:hypothetical protein